MYHLFQFVSDLFSPNTRGGHRGLGSLYRRRKRSNINHNISDKDFLSFFITYELQFDPMVLDLNQDSDDSETETELCDTLPNNSLLRNGLGSTGFTWPGGIIPYEVRINKRIQQIWKSL